jgi:hypothetical protein
MVCKGRDRRGDSRKEYKIVFKNVRKLRSLAMQAAGGSGIHEEGEY